MKETSPLSTESAADILQGTAELVADALHLELGECRIRVRSNSAELISHLGDYFGHITGPVAEPTMDVIAIERDALSPEKDLGITFRDWRREPGKTGRKDSYYDLPDARLVRKVRTGMVFLQSETRRIAAGPCRKFDNQVINFINAQYMNWLQQRGWLICHASGLVQDGRALGIAGFSGGGKSTLMLHLLEQPGVSYLTNDRLFIRRSEETLDAIGIPKLPRVNPGTIVHNPMLHPLIPEEQRAALLKLPPEDLWHLEDKYDVIVDQLYGPDRISPSAPLGSFLILNWNRDSKDPLQLLPVDIDNRRDLLHALMKSSGPFYQYADGHFYDDQTTLDEAAYLAQLGDLPVYEAVGGVDFDALEKIVLARLMGKAEAGNVA